MTTESAIGAVPVPSINRAPAIATGAATGGCAADGPLNTATTSTIEQARHHGGHDATYLSGQVLSAASPVSSVVERLRIAYLTANTQMAPPSGTSGIGRSRLKRDCMPRASMPQPDCTAM